MWFRRDGDSILFPTSRHTRKAKNLRRHPQATAMIDRSRSGLDLAWRSDQGTVELIEGDTGAPAQPLDPRALHHRARDSTRARRHRLPVRGRRRDGPAVDRATAARGTSPTERRDGRSRANRGVPIRSTPRDTQPSHEEHRRGQARSSHRPRPTAPTARRCSGSSTREPDPGRRRAGASTSSRG